jgi:hypothetical protein
MSGDAPLTPVSALERSMGLAAVSRPPHFDGEIDSDPDATPPPGRTTVHYGNDALFDDSPAAGSNSDNDGGANIMDLMGALGPDGNTGALIAQLEAMADEFERQSGEPETEIRGKIAMLKGILDSHPTAVAQSRARMVSALDAVVTDETTPAAAAAYRNEAAVQSACTNSCMQTIETEMETVGSMLRDDPAAAAVVANLVAKGQCH